LSLIYKVKLKMIFVSSMRMAQRRREDQRNRTRERARINNRQAA